MSLRIATFNVENLFTRPRAMKDGMGQAGQDAIDHDAELNRIVGKPVYVAADKARLLELDQIYDFSALSPPSNALVELNKIRGQLYSRSQAGVVTVVANGRGDWTGWFFLRPDDVTWEATFNTGRVMAEVDAHIQICVEVENRPTLLHFNEQVLKAKFNKSFPHVMVIDGNDERGIDVGIMSRYPIRSIKSHVDDLNDNGERTFSRDCPEYAIDLPSGRKILVLPNHFKSKRGGNSPAVQAKRKAQADRAHAIAKDATALTQLVLIGGDLNDTPDTPLFESLWQDGFVDVRDHPSYPTDRPGTFDTGTAANKIDYLIMSPKLRAKLTNTGIERRGSYHPNTWVPFDTVKKKADEASDHHLVWADFSL
jgi:endonuclease/exonuclease/phosphatase family metal-dependent hydrolase